MQLHSIVKIQLYDIYIYLIYIYIQFLRLSQAILLLIMCKYSYIYNHICIYSEMYLIYIYIIILDII